MAKLLLLNKPFNVLCQFTDTQQRATLADFIHQSGFYPAGRLDYDSEGLVLLTDDGKLQHRIADPAHKLPKTYWVQVEGVPDDSAIHKLQQGVVLNDGPTRPAKVTLLAEPSVWPRTPPVRVRQHITDTWLELTITEGRNRQVRRMTAAIGHPTLRLIRTAIGAWSIGKLQPGQWQQQTVHMPTAANTANKRRRR